MRKRMFLNFVMSAIMVSASVVLTHGCFDDRQLSPAVDIGQVMIDNAVDNVIPVTSGSTVQVGITLKPKSSDSVSEFTDVGYSSSDEGIFTVNTSGIITGQMNGEAILTVSAQSEDSEIKGSCIVETTGQKFVEKIELDGAAQNIELSEGEEFDLSPYVTVSPSDAYALQIQKPYAAQHRLLHKTMGPSLDIVPAGGLLPVLCGGM